MPKTKTIYICQNCGAQSPKWIGKCPSCNEWNTYIEEVVTKSTNRNPETSVVGTGKYNSDNIKPIKKISIKHEERIDTGNLEFNRVLGGGLVPGSLVLIGGEPGIGKSTLALQIALNISLKVLYISGEESLGQIRLRAERVGIKNENCYILSETLLENIFAYINHINPDIIVIDSIQTIYTERIESSPGSITQIRECTTAMLKNLKEKSIPVFLIGHINKEGNLAGPKVLEHIVDTVLQFEGDRNYLYRILRTRKNRFGSTSEIGIFEMQNSGLREVSNPSELLLTQHNDPISGVAISASIEGIRPFLIEVQSLVSSAVYGTPQRSSTGYDLRRLNMLLAVLEKKAGFRLAAKDVFMNIAGGIKVNDPAIDLSVICAILSSDQDIRVNSNICFAGEVGLTGEIRQVNRIEQRVGEAAKLGFKEIVVSKHDQKRIDFSKFDISIKFMNKIEDVFAYLFG